MIDTLPGQIANPPTLMNAGGSYDNNNKTVTWNIDDLPPGATGTRDVVVTVPIGTANGLTLTNTVALSASNAQTVNDLVTNLVGSSANLRIELNVDHQIASAGNVLTYTAAVQNIGNGIANNVTLEFPMPIDTIYVSNSAGVDLISNKLSFNVGNLAPGNGRTFLIYATIIEPLSNGTQILGLSTASSSNAPSVSASTTTQVISSPLLTLTKIAQKQVAAGKQLLYSLQYSNKGSDVANNVILQDTLPLNTQLSSATSGGVFSQGQVIWNLGSLQPGESGSVSVLLDVDNSIANDTLLVNQASIKSNENPPVSTIAPTRVTSAPILRVEKIADTNPVQSGGSVTFTIKYYNDGNDVARDAKLIDQLPPGRSTVVYPNDATYDQNAGTLSWNLGDIPVGGSGFRQVTVSFDASLQNGLLLTNSANLSATNAIPTSMQIPVVIANAPNLQVNLIPNKISVTTNEPIEYIVELKNIGSTTANKIPMLIPIPPDLTFVSVTHGGMLVNGSVQWLIDQLEPGKSLKHQLTLKVRNKIKNATVITNTVMVTPDNGNTVISQEQISVSDIPSGSGSSSQTKSIPTLNEWAMLILMIMIFGVSYYQQRRMLK